MDIGAGPDSRRVLGGMAGMVFFSAERKIKVYFAFNFTCGAAILYYNGYVVLTRLLRKDAGCLAGARLSEAWQKSLF